MVEFGWAIQHNEEGSTPPCLKDQNHACPAGVADCSIDACDSPGDDESQINVFCSAP